MSLQLVRISQAVLLLVFSLISYYCIDSAKKGNIPKIRRLPALDAMEETVQRAVEVGGTVHFTTGAGEKTGLYGPNATQIIAGINVLGHLSKLTASYDVPLLATTGYAAAVPIMADIIQGSYIAAGKKEAYNPSLIQFYSDNQFTHAAVLMGIFKREKIAANIMVGPLWAQSLLLAESAREVGAVQIGGTANTHQISFMIAVCDYSLISEEIFAAGAYLSQDPVQLGTIRGQDMIRIILIAFIMLGVILANLKIPWFSNILLM